MNGGYNSGIGSSNCTGMEAAWSDLAPNWTAMDTMAVGVDSCYGNSGCGSSYGDGGRWDPSIGCCSDNSHRDDALGLTWNNDNDADGWNVNQSNAAYSQSMMMGGMMEGGVGSIGGSYGNGSSIGGGWGCNGSDGCFVGDVGGNNRVDVGNDGLLPGFGGASDNCIGGSIADPDSDPVDFDIDGLFPSATSTGDYAGGPMVGAGSGIDCGAPDCRNPWLCQQPQAGQFSFF